MSRILKIIAAGFACAFMTGCGAAPESPGGTTLALQWREPEDGTILSPSAATMLRVSVQRSGGAFEGSMAIVSDVDGEICRREGGGADFTCDGAGLSAGEHTLTATAVGADGATAASSVSISVMEAEDGTSPQPIPGNEGKFAIDESIVPSTPAVPGLEGGADRPVCVAMGPDGLRDEFVADEIVFHPESEEALAAFLERYDGVIVRESLYPAVLDGETGASESSGWYLVRINPAASGLEDLPENITAAGVDGEVRFSCEDGARLAALMFRETDLRVEPNFLTYDLAVNEHPSGGGYLDAEEWWWMSEDDSPFSAGDQGLSTGVIHAWEYMRYMNVPPSPDDGGSTVWSPVDVAVVDRGFALDPSTGEPLNDNVDYFYLGAAPAQFDFADNDNRAGANEAGWHGQKAFGVCCARPRNLYGTAGTGGPVARPMLLRVGQTAYSVADGIAYAGIWGADVVTVSLGRYCGFFCQYIEDADGSMQSAVYTAVTFGATVLAGAGNGDNETNLSYDISDMYFAPCKLDKVICVGGINDDGLNVYNYGEGVDIWAPSGILSTPTPDTADLTGAAALPIFRGTSSATPYAAGVVALMKAMDPALRWHEIERILQDTANASTDPEVSLGYIDAYRAVMAAGPVNQPPSSVEITLPSDGAEISWSRQVGMIAEVIDPESPDVFRGTVEFRSDRDGLLCRSPCTFEGAPLLTPGTHVITARAIDPHGAATESAPITIEIINSAPITQITYPDHGSTVYTDQLVNLRGWTFDWDQEIPDSLATWESSIDGDLGAGTDLWVSLTSGEHTLTLRAEDSFGLTGENQIKLTVKAGIGVPTARIFAPREGAMFAPGQMVTLEGKGTDPEDGNIEGDRLRWYSDRDGFLGSGELLEVSLSGPDRPCHPELVTHVITLEVTDRDGNVTTHTVEVLVGVIC